MFGGIALTTVLRRLRMLEDEYYLKRIEGLITHELLWAVTDKGALSASVTVPKRHWSKNMLDHDYKLLSLRLVLEGNGIAHSWTPEHEIRSMVFKKYEIRGAKDRVISDGLMSVFVDGKMESVAVELELTLKNAKKLSKVLRHYRGCHDLLAVWYIVPNPAMANQIHRVWNQCGLYATQTKIFYSYLDEVMKNPKAARLMSAEKPKALSDYWRVLPAQVGAHHLSTHEEQKNENKIEVTEENHAPILNIAS